MVFLTVSRVVSFAANLARSVDPELGTYHPSMWPASEQGLNDYFITSGGMHGYWVDGAIG